MVRAQVHLGNIDKANEIKRTLPMFLFMAAEVKAHLYEGKTAINKGRIECWRSQKHIYLNGLVMLDFDNMAVEPRDYFESVINHFICLLDIVLVHITPKGKGLRLVCKADPAVGNLADNQKRIAKRLGLPLDEACKDSSRGSFVCKKEDVLYLNDELFTYENEDYDKKYGESYRAGNCRGYAAGAAPAAHSDGNSDGKGDQPVGKDNGQTSGTAEQSKITLTRDEDGNYCFGALRYADIQKALWEAYGGRPAVGARHTGVLAMAGRLRYICENSAANIRAVIDDCGLPAAEVDDIVSAVVGKPMAPFIPPKVRQVIQGLCVKRNVPSPFSEAGGRENGRGAGMERAVAVDYGYWAKRLHPLLCNGLDDAVKALPDDIKIGGAMAAAAMFGTYLTRCTFLHGDGEQRRLSFLVYIIGLPASGKSFLPVLDRLIMEPMRVADETGRRQEQQYKEDMKKRESSSKNQKEAAQEVPHPVIRYVPSSISNAMLYTRLRDAKETVNGEEMHLHLYTCEAELAAALRAQTGSWAGKLDLECKSFQNEECGVDFKNSESANGIYQVNWNQCVSGTPDALRRKFKMTNALDGLTTRIALFEMPEQHFNIRALKTSQNRDFDLEARLRSWGYRLDKLYGELICPKLVEAAWEWLKDVSDEAQENDDIITDFFDKRVTMYFVRYGLVHNVLRDIAYIEQLMKDGKPLKLRINKSDIEFGRLMADFILMMQIRMFGEQTWNALETAKKDFVPRKRMNRFAALYAQLPDAFSVSDVANIFDIKENAASQYLIRIQKRGLVKRVRQGQYQKIVKSEM